MVGGGFSGVLLALKLSQNHAVTLLEEKATLGGRFFFSQTHEHASGPGFELLDQTTQQKWFQAFYDCLSPQEKQHWDEEALSFALQNPAQKPRIFFVKKELTPSQQLLSESSEVLTKKEALLLASLCDPLGSVESKAKIWNETQKAQKEALTPIVETLVGVDLKNIPPERLFSELSHFFYESTSGVLDPFLQKNRLPGVFEKILSDRGVVIRKQCRLLRVSKSKDKKFDLLMSDEKQPDQKTLQSSCVVFAMPLAQCAGMMEKELYAPEQSRFISRSQPLSMVMIEMPHFLDITSYDKQTFFPKDQFVFPVERARGFLTSDFRILFFTLLEYENSLQAPAVREAVSRLRRAAARVLKTEVSQEQRRGPRMPQQKLLERIILLPVAHSFAFDVNQQQELKQTKMGAQNLFCCGDSFYTLGQQPWQRLFASVDDVVNQLGDKPI